MASDHSPPALEAKIQGSPTGVETHEEAKAESSSLGGHSKVAEAPAKLLHRTTSRVSHSEKADGGGVSAGAGNGNGNAYEGRVFGQAALGQLTSRVEEGFMHGLHNFELIIEDEFSPQAKQHRRELWNRFRGKNRRHIGVAESALNVARSSVLNVLLIIIPFAWASHFHWKNDTVTFTLCFLSIIPLERLFDYGGEQMAFYTGKQLGDLITITLNNAVEAALAIILLLNSRCELRLLQATIIGVVLLHLLLIPGTAFLTGGARIWEQNLHPHPTQLNHTLLTIGVLSLLIPAAFFSALNDITTTTEDTVVNDETRHLFLQMSRGIAIMLLLVYIASRIFLHNPPGEGNALMPGPNAPKEIHEEEHHLAHGDPEVSSWFCIVFLLVTIAIMAVTAEMLVESIEFVREQSSIKEEWFGLVLLPIVSFSADGAVAILYFVRAAFFLKPEAPATLAKGRAIDLSIQFTLFWMPFLILLAWWTNKPLTLLFDFYEVALVLGACFLVNYVTADSKTNWVEGFIMVAFYIMIALCSWFYPGQESIEQMLDCASVAEALAEAAGGGGATESGVVEGAVELAHRFFRR